MLLKLEVEDSGIGIKESDMERLFMNFTRLDEQKNRNIQGTGLGLNLTKNLVEMDGVQTLNAMKLLPRIQKKHKLFLRKVHWKNAFHI